jgi:hypothetical protein
MNSRIPLLAILLPALAFASADPGDTLLSQASNLDLGSWVIDGTKVSTQYKCTDLIPGTCSYSLTASDSISLLPGSPAGGVFLRVLSANSLSPVPTKRQATFVHGEWWKVKGKTGYWALEVDSSYFQSYYATDQTPDTLTIHPHWARIQTGRPWVKWVDTVENRLLSRGDMGKILTTETHLLRCLLDTSFVIDTIYGRLKAVYPVSQSLGVHWSTAISLSIPDSSIPFFSSVLDSNGARTSVGTFRGARIGDTGSLVAGTYVVWTSNSGYIDPSSWLYLPAPTYPFDMVVSAFWTFRIAGATDSMVSLGIIPTGAFEGVIPRFADSAELSLHAVDLAGRPVPLGQALPLGPHLASVEGRLQTVIVRP